MAKFTTHFRSFLSLLSSVTLYYISKAPHRVKQLPKITLAIYLTFLLWLVLFKTSVDFVSVLGHDSRVVNLIPFAGATSNLREMLENIIVFIPFGLLLGVSFKQLTLWQKLAASFAVSLLVEALQLALAIGVTDITDVIANTLGGLIGLGLYDLRKHRTESPALDTFICIACLVLLAVLAWLRFFVFRVRY